MSPPLRPVNVIFSASPGDSKLDCMATAVPRTEAALREQESREMTE